MNTKAIEIAKEMKQLGILWAPRTWMLINAVLSEERADSDEYDYHTTVGEVIQADWEYESEPGVWNETDYAGRKIGDKGTWSRYRSKCQSAWVPKAGEWVMPNRGDSIAIKIYGVHTDFSGETWLSLDSERIINLRFVRQPTPAEIAIAERREKLPPIPPKIPEGYELIGGNETIQKGDMYWLYWSNGAPYEDDLWSECCSSIGGTPDKFNTINKAWVIRKKPIRTEEATSGKTKFRVEREGVYRRRDGSIVSLRKYHESWRVCEYDHPRYVNAAGRWSGGIESPEDVIEYLATLTPDGSQLLNKKVGESLPKDGILYCCPTKHTDAWIASSHLTAKTDYIYAHKPASEQPKPITHWQITTDQNGEREW